MRGTITNSFYCLMLALLSSIGTPLAAQAQQAEVLALKQERINYEPQGYYIANVVDDRKQTDNVGTAKKGIPIIFGESAAPALMHFIERNVKQNKGKMAMSLHISKFNIRVRQSGSGWHTETDVLFTFYYGGTRLAELGSTGQATSPEYSLKYGEELVRKSLTNVLKNFDKWWAQNKDQVPLSNTVTLNVSIARSCNQEGLIAYSRQQPLRIADFKAPNMPKKLRTTLPSDIAACTVSTIEKTSRMEVRESQHVLDVVLTPAFDTHESWFKSGITDAGVLAHEQTHFDITALKTCELRNALSTLKLTSDNFKETLTGLFNKFDNEWTDEQNLYDQETDHGTITDKQKAWEEKVNTKLKQEGCY